MPDRLINETDTLVLLPAYEVLGVPNVITNHGLVPLEELTSADINYYAAVTSLNHANAGAGGNVSCAILTDGFTSNFTDSEEEDEKTLCDPANMVQLGDKNFENDWTGFRDRFGTVDDSVFALWESLTFAADVQYIGIHRVGYASDVPFAAGHEYDAFYMHTDHSVPVHADGAKQKIKQTFIPKNESSDARVLMA